MKRAEVGRFRVLLDDCGEGAVVIDHASATRLVGADEQQLAVRFALEPGELADLLVAIDSVSNELPPPKIDEPRARKVERVMREAAHALRVLGVNARVEFRVEHWVAHDLADQLGREIEQVRPDRGKLDLGVGDITFVRGMRI